MNPLPRLPTNHGADVGSEFSAASDGEREQSNQQHGGLHLGHRHPS
jgi:hypothetical protein